MKRYLITGASRGIGGVIAEELADADHTLDLMLPPEEIAAAVAYVLSRPMDVAVENINLQNLAGRL